MIRALGMRGDIGGREQHVAKSTAAEDFCLASEVRRAGVFAGSCAIEPAAGGLPS